MKSKFLLFITATILFVACKKNDIVEEIKSPTTDITTSYKAIASQIITTAKANDNFRTLAYIECNKQKFGDYYVKLNELFSLNKSKGFWDVATVDKLTSLQNTITQKTGRDVIIFIPSIERRPEKAVANKSRQRTAEVQQEPVAVIADEYVPIDQTSPGYIVENNGTLTFYQTINESFAWENDVWVFGEEEVVSPENMVAAPEDTATLVYARVQGGAEYGGIVKVTDWSLVEPWILGKPEFRMVVYKGAGTATTIADKSFGKWRRANFNGQFKDFNYFIYYWNTPNIGDYTSEKWIEEDGGTLFTLTFGVKIKILGVETNVGVSLPIKNNDDDLGLSLIQFTDPISTVYSQSGIEIKRRD